MAVGCDLLPEEMFSCIADTPKGLHAAAFETMYFNTGSEWIIHDEENTPEGPEDISGYSCYIVADTEEGIRKELAAVAGCAPSDIVMWAFDEFIRVAQYKAV